MVREVWGPEHSPTSFIGMGDIFEIASTFAQNATGVLGITGRERSTCPRCKGSGLCEGRSVWKWGQAFPSNASCWFCDGMGVMSIVGLNGYMLGRTDAIVRTKEIKNRPGIPVDVHLHPGKIFGPRCKLRSHRPSTGLSQMLYDPLSCQHWLHDAEREAMSSHSDLTEVSESLPDRSPFNGMANFTNPEHCRRHYGHRFYARATAPFSDSCPSGAAYLPQPDKTYSTLSLWSGRNGESAPDNVQSSKLVDNELSGFAIDESKSGKPMFRRLRSHVSPRRPRNRIREEAEKEAAARAERVRKSSLQKPEAPASTLEPVLGMCRKLFMFPMTRLQGRDNGSKEH